MLFDEVVFGQKRVDLARANDIAKICDVFEHRHNLCCAVGQIEKVRAKSVFEILRLADVDNLALLVKHHINARIVGYVFYFCLEINHFSLCFIVLHDSCFESIVIKFTHLQHFSCFYPYFHKCNIAVICGFDRFSIRFVLI